MTFCLHELSQNPEIQVRVREEIIDVLAKHDGKITYEALSEMTYLEQCINGKIKKLILNNLINFNFFRISSQISTRGKFNSRSDKRL